MTGPRMHFFPGRLVMSPTQHTTASLRQMPRPSLYHLNPFTYIVLAVVIVVATGILFYIIASCYRSAGNNHERIGESVPRCISAKSVNGVMKGIRRRASLEFEHNRMAAKTNTQAMLQSSPLTRPPAVYDRNSGYFLSSTASMPNTKGPSSKTPLASRKPLAPKDITTMRTNPKLVPVLDPIILPATHSQFSFSPRSTRGLRKGCKENMAILSHDMSRH